MNHVVNNYEKAFISFERHGKFGRRDRSVTVFGSGVRAVTLFFGDGESWYRYVIIPRAWRLRQLRKLRAQGCRHIEFWDLIPQNTITQAYAFGPGRSFASPPDVYLKTRRYLVITQRGGLDI